MKKFLPHLTGACGLLLLLHCTSSFAATDQARSELSQIQQAIQDSQAHWVARETSVSGLSMEQKRKLAGVLPQPAGHRASYRNPKFQAQNGQTLPAQFDWRNYNGHSYVTSIKNQGACGSCWAFSVTAALESKALISLNTPDSDLNLSEQIVLSCSQAGSCAGGWPDQATNFLVGSGSAAQSYYPYTGANGSCASAATGWQNQSYKIKNWQYVVENAQPSVNAIKNALYNNGPLVATMMVYNDFYYYSSGVYSYTNGPYLGAHAILIVGWDDSAQAFIIKNSWGSAWGESGFVEIAYSQLSSVIQLGNQMVLADGDAIPPAFYCKYALSQTSATVTAAGSKASLRLSAPNGCVWKASSNASWLTLTSDQSGAGNATVNYAVAANTDRSARSAALEIANQAFSVTQAGARPDVPICTLSAQPDSIALGASASLSVSCNPVASSYLWVRSGFGPQQNSGQVFPTSTTLYSVSASNAAGSGNMASATVTVAQGIPPTPTALSAPDGNISSLAPRYSWNAVPGASEYWLYVRSASGAVLIDSAYSAAALGCASANGVCSISPASLPTPETNYLWYVAAANSAGYSPWSIGKAFSVSTTAKHP
jgi:C1A family cysteine protease